MRHIVVTQGADERQRVRSARARPLVDAFKPWLEDQLHRLPPRGGVAGAIRYVLARWSALCGFLDDGRIELDNNQSSAPSGPWCWGAGIICSRDRTEALTDGQ